MAAQRRQHRGRHGATYTIPVTTTLDSGAKFRAKVTGPSAYGVLQDGATWTTGRSGSAINFDGTNDYLGTSSDLSSILGGTSSLTFWIKTTQVGNNTMWLAPGISGVESAGNANDVFWGWIDGTGRIGLQAGDTAGAKYQSDQQQRVAQHRTHAQRGHGAGKGVRRRRTQRHRDVQHRREDHAVREPRTNRRHRRNTRVLQGPTR